MAHVEASEILEGAFYTVSPAAWQLALDMAQRRAPYETVALAVQLQSFGLPDVGTVQVPVQVEAGKAFGIPPSEFALTVAAERANQFFPRFEGRIAIREKGGTHACLCLTGNYTAPLGGVGRMADATIMHGVAEASLRTFLHWFAKETAARIARGEYRTAAELMREGGD